MGKGNKSRMGPAADSSRDGGGRDRSGREEQGEPALPKILGILNITRDSFSDGGLYAEPSAAIRQARQLIEGGADIIDIGAASSHPDAEPVSAAEEIRRLRPVMEFLDREGILFSVDSFQPEVQRFAITGGAAFLNDVAGFGSPSFYPELARSNCRLILMHSLQHIETEPEAIYDRILSFFERRLRLLSRAGIEAGRIILDPGMGLFLSPRPESSLFVLGRLSKLKELFGLPLLISVSRKSFLGAIAGRPIAERGAATLAAELYAYRERVDYIRTHDAAALRDGLRVWNQIVKLRS